MKNKNGFSIIIILAAVLVISIVGGATYAVLTRDDEPVEAEMTTQEEAASMESGQDDENAEDQQEAEPEVAESQESTDENQTENTTTPEESVPAQEPAAQAVTQEEIDAYQTRSNQLGQISEEQFASMSQAEQDNVRREAAEVVYAAIRLSGTTDVSSVKIDEVADEHYGGESFKVPFVSYASSSSDVCSPDPGGLGLRFRYQRSVDSAGTLRVCLSSGAKYTATN